MDHCVLAFKLRSVGYFLCLTGKVYQAKLYSFTFEFNCHFTYLYLIFIHIFVSVFSVVLTLPCHGTSGSCTNRCSPLADDGLPQVIEYVLNLILNFRPTCLKSPNCWYQSNNVILLSNLC